jgi:predicted lactoylglutathione lyase
MAARGADIFTPRMRPDINDTYFGAMFTDLDGHRIEVVTHAE